jgi:chemotaxis protein methyltransferase CheR
MGEPLQEDDIGYVCDLVRRHCGVVLHPAQAWLIEARLLLAARRLGPMTPRELVEALRGRPEGALHADVVEEIAPGDTRFFGEPEAFRSLREVVLPALIERRGDERSLRIWSAGCSTGQEPYSIALMLDEDFPALSDWDVTIVASDFSGAALERVAGARYSQLEVNRGLLRSSLDRYFDREDVYWNLRDDVKRRVRPEKRNLVVGAWSPIEPMDVVFLRNVLLYLDEDARRTVLRRVHGLLRDDGALFLGGTETPLSLEGAFDRLGDGSSAIYRPRAMAA